MTVNAPILVILGPTASGKTDLALAVARRLKAEILSVDSMQIYRGMDIGTAKPTPAERAEAPHHLIDLVEADQPFTVARFVELADAAIADAAQRHVPLIATGGTPLYYKALFEGLFEGPPANPELRQRLAALGGEAMHARLSAADPAAASRIHPNDTKRLIRALEVHELTGRPISEFQTDWSAGRQRHQATWIGLNWEREALNRRINARVKRMLEAGWPDETRALVDAHGRLSATAGEATGYELLIEHLNGRLSLDDAAEGIKIATRQLARRQMKWFRRFPGVHWLKGDAPLEENVATVLRIWTAAPGEHTTVSGID